MRGFIDNEELPDWYRAADVVVLPSRWEGCPVVGIEAMACGTPLVASYNLGTPQVVEGFECGLLVPPDDAVALANAVSDVLRGREAFRPNLLKARSLFDWSVVVDQRLSLYRSILGASCM
jgi:glycosyltransferase involved in cell wall biosynthesis